MVSRAHNDILLFPDTHLDYISQSPLQLEEGHVIKFWPMEGGLGPLKTPTLSSIPSLPLPVS